LTDQTSVIRFIEDNWLGGQRIGNGSFDTIAEPHRSDVRFHQDSDKQHSHSQSEYGGADPVTRAGFRRQKTEVRSHKVGAVLLSSRPSYGISHHTTGVLAASWL
jgi:hypothetical protein